MIYLLFLLLLELIFSSNLDVQSPHIIQGGQSGSLFGYSVLLHNTTPHQNVYLVGAPRANTSQNLTAPGAVYQCQVDFGEHKQTTNCTKWVDVFDDTDDHVYTITGTSPEQIFSTTTETKSNQFFGVALLKSETSVIGCAHLYKDHYGNKNYKVERRLPIGRCSFVNHALSARQKFLHPCKNIADSHDSYGACLAGVSAAQHDTEILISAPNANGGYGNSFLYNDSVNTSSNNILELLTSTWSGTRASGLESETNDYAGYSTVFCDLNGDGHKELVLGMPRSYNYKGSIRVHYGTRPEQAANKPSYENATADPDEVEAAGTGGNPDTSQYRNLKILCPTDDGHCKVPRGGHMGSYFGHTLACADLNGDGLDDLIVSSPYFSHKSGKHQRTMLGDRGKVVVYFGRLEDFMFPYPDFEERESVELFGTETSGALFGYSLNTDSDLNGDGVKDLIVGAPYENGGAGAIYVFNGGAGLFYTAYSQRITPSDLDENLQTFGSSISGGMNVDNIGFDDLLVGAFKSDKAVVLRTIPTVNIEPTLILLHPVVNLENATYTDPTTGEATVGNTLRINVSTIGMTISRRNITFPTDDLELNWKITLDPINSSPEDKRAYIKLNSSSSAIYEHRGVVKLQSNKVVTLPDIINILLKRKTIRNVKELYIAIDGQIVAGNTFSSKQALEYEKFRSAKIPIKIETQCDKETGICESDVGLSQLRVSSPQGYDQIVINEVTNIYVDVSITNNGPKTAYDTTLALSVPSSLIFYDYEVSGAYKDVECRNVTDNVTCEVIGGFDVGERNIRIMFLVNNTRLVPNIRGMVAGSVSVELPSQDPHPDNNARGRALYVRQLADLELVGGPKRETQLFNNKLIDLFDPGNFKEIGPEVRHLLEVRIDELADVAVISDIVLEVKWPLKYAGKFVLYLTEIHIPELYRDKLSCSTVHVDPLSLGPAAKATNYNRAPTESDAVARTTEVVQEEKVSLLAGGETSVDCSRDPSSCQVINCHISQLERGANNKSQVRLELRARLWESTFDSYYRVNVTSLSRIKSVGNELVLPHTKFITKAITSKFFIPNKRKSLNLIIILLSILAGLLILAVIVFVLWKKNFFKSGQLELMRTPDYMFQTGCKSETLQAAVFTASS